MSDYTTLKSKWDSLVNDRLKAMGHTPATASSHHRQRAVSAVAKANPELRQNLVAAANADRVR